MPDFSKIAIDGTSYNVKDSSARSDISTLTSRMDQFVQLPAGSTSGDAELQDIRVGVDGTTYNNAGTAVRTQVGDLKDNVNNAITNQTAISFTPDYSVITGKYLGTNNTIGTNVEYAISSPIPLLPGQLISLTGFGKHSSISMISPTTEFGVPTGYVVAYSNTQGEYLASFLNTLDTVQYVRCCWLNTNSYTITVYNDHLINPDDTSTIKLQSIMYRLDGTSTRVRYATDWKTSGNYACTTPIHLNSGETIHLYGRVSTNMPAFIKCNKFGGGRTFVVDGLGYTHHNYTATEDCYVMAQYKTDEANIEVNKTFNWNTEILKNDRRHGTICFIFDDATANDYRIVDIFEARGLRCGFALISTIAVNNRVNEYLDYQKRGFNILSHSTDNNTMNDPEADTGIIAAAILNSGLQLIRAGFDIRGWVTPSSAMANVFKYYLYNPYSYGYTIYYGAYQEGSRSYNLFSDSPYDLWRLDLMNSLDNLKSAVDQCYDNKGFLTIYCHPAQMQDSHFTRLADLLDYILPKVAENKLKCLAPNDAYEYYYNVRRQDIVS